MILIRYDHQLTNRAILRLVLSHVSLKSRLILDGIDMYMPNPTSSFLAYFNLVCPS